MKKYFIPIIAASLIFSGCFHRNNRLEAVLDYSGNNRGELEKVLAHYSQDPADSLKLQAAIFLIENMPGHYSLTSPLLESYYAKVDTIKNIPYSAKKLMQIIPYNYPEFRNDLQIQEDVKCITADFLIHNIDLAFRQWETLPWTQDLDFETFKEALLPYRIANEPLDYWRDSIEYFQKKLRQSIDNYDDCRYSAKNMSYKLLYFLHIPSLIPDERLKGFDMDCIPTSQYNLFTKRICGIPSVIDFIPHFANRNGRHYWAVILDSKYQSLKVVQADMYRAAKIYRQTYAHQPVVTPKRQEYVPAFFRNPFHKDVTKEYIPTTDVTIRLPRGTGAKHAYLAIFNDLTWKPIACAEVSGRKACFRHMGRDAVYLPVYYNREEEMLPLDNPFLLASDGSIYPFEPSKEKTDSLILTRKYPNSSMHDFWGKSILKTRFEASNDKDFKQRDTIYTINQQVTLDYQYVYPDSTLKRRYWRFACTPPQTAYLSQMAFYDENGQQLNGKLIGPDSTQAGGLLEDDPVFYCQIKNWVGMDFGKEVGVSKIRFLPRNDGNTIFPGDDYELFYYQYPEGWISLGMQTAEREELIYTNVPAGSLYWLRNLTTGKEERIFVKKGNNIVFL